MLVFQKLPFKKIGYHSIDRRGQQRAWLNDAFGFRHEGCCANRPTQLVRRRKTHMRPHVAKMRSEQPVEFRLEVRLEIIAVPPEPVAALGGVEFVPCRSRAVRRKSRCDGCKARSGVAQDIPASIVLLMADPDFIVGIDP